MKVDINMSNEKKNEVPSLKQLFEIIQDLQKRIENIENCKDKVYSEINNKPLLPKKTIVLKED